MATAALPFHSAYIPKQPFEEAGIAAARSLKVYAAASGYLVPEGQSRDLIEFLRHITAVRQYARVLPIAGTMTIPTMTAGAAAQYLGELVDDLAQDLVFGQRRLVSHKLRALIEVSNDLVRNASPEADTMVRDELAGALAEAEDLAFLRGSGVGESPKGIRFWCPSSQVVNGTAATDAAIETDLVAMVARFVAAMRGRQSQPRWFMPSRSYYRLFNAKRATTDLLIFPEIRNTPPQLIGFPVTITDQIPVNLAPSTSTEILLADMSEVLIGDEMSLSIAFGCRRISR